MERVEPNILLVVNNHELAVRIQKSLPKNFMVVGYLAALTGRVFDVVIFQMPRRDHPEQVYIDDWMHTSIMTRVKPGGVMHRI
jgi:hypothetical protein